MYKKYLYFSVWTSLIIYASVTSNESLPKFQVFEHFDKVVHFCMYFGQSFLLVPIFTKLKFKYLLSICIAIAFGMLMELVQGVFTENRSADGFDVLANSLGALFGVFSYRYLILSTKWESIFFK
jgi:VanZ family protein